VKTALITGITGQDGSYLAEFLLEQGYRVVGMVRRSSTENFSRIQHLTDRPEVEIVQGDLLDQYSLIALLQQYRPGEVYNLAAQSFVPTSWNQPVLTGEFTALGVTRVLEAVRLVDPSIRFYQASSSEMFGKVQETPQTETTSFYPRSPYGVAKVYGHWITVNYRESYDLYTCSGILFNHECLSATTPLIVQRDGVIDITTPDKLVPLLRKGRSQQTFDVPGLEIWGGTGWTLVQAITATRRRATDPDHQMLMVQARGGVVEVTAHHHMLDADHETVQARNVEQGSRLALAEGMPHAPEWTSVSPETAEFLGLLTAEGYVSPIGQIQFTNNDAALRDQVATLWSKLFLGTTRTAFLPSGFNAERTVGQLYLNGDRAIGVWLREQLYDGYGEKRVPRLILNASREAQQAYLKGYYAGDGLKAGNGDSIRTGSALLAQGLYWLYANQGRWCSVYAEQRGERVSYQLNVDSGNPIGQKGQHLRKPAAEVRRVTESIAPEEWVFDLETESGVLCAGVGGLVVHNSPRRGLEFVTRKVTYNVAKIHLGLSESLTLGNLDSQRDWGYAKEYVEAMWLMLQQDTPDDYVVATGETHAVQELVEIAFGRVGRNWQDHVRIDPALVRPAEVDLLLGDAGKARRVLGWEPKTSFKELVELMVDTDIALLREESGHGRR